MAIDLAGFAERTAAAVQMFWDARADAASRQKEGGTADRGERGAVTSGKTMDGFVDLIASLVTANGLGDAQICLRRGVITLPGYFRPSKDWDLLVMHRRRLVAAIELKSQVGPSFGNNFNNRAEEVIGSAVDLWTAYREGAFGTQARPFLGWIVHVEDAPTSRTPVQVREPHFVAFGENRDRSYLERYEVLCRKLVTERLYTEAALVTSTREGGCVGEYADQSEATSIRRFAATFAAHIAAESAMTSPG